jgi:biotin operon repressor
MSKATKIIKLGGMAYFEKHLEILAAILPVKITAAERRLLAAFMFFDSEDLSDFHSRQKVRRLLTLSSSSLSSSIAQLKQKGIIMEKDGALAIFPLILPDKQTQEYQFRLEKCYT